MNNERLTNNELSRLLAWQFDISKNQAKTMTHILINYYRELEAVRNAVKIGHMSDEEIERCRQAYRRGYTVAVMPSDKDNDTTQVHSLQTPLDKIENLTKDEEREILDHIKGILDRLPEDSYVRTAFAGCVDLARDNIEHDWLHSMPARIHYLETLLYVWGKI